MRLAIFVTCAVVLSAAAFAVRVTDDEHLRRGWYRIPSGTVYLSDGNGNVCGYPSWQQFIGAGGISDGWKSLSELPKNLKDTGPCPIHEDRADWLSRGIVHVLGPTPPIWSDGRGHVCYTSRLDGPNIYVKALPEGFKLDGMCEGEVLAKTLFQTRDGQIYDSDGDGHVCELLHAGVRGVTSLWALPEGTTNDGPCPDRTEPPLPFGWYRLPSGDLFLANGSGDACLYSGWEEFANAGGRDGTWTEIPKLPIGTSERPECESPHRYQPGWQLVANRVEPVFVDDKNVMCGATWKQFFAAGGQLSKLVQWGEEPRVRWMEPCAIEVPKKLETANWLAAGWFRTGDGAVYLSDGNGHVCGYASWSQFTSSPARGLKSAWTQTDVLPPTGVVDVGVCPDIEIEIR